MRDVVYIHMTNIYIYIYIHLCVTPDLAQYPKNAAVVSKSNFFPCENIHIYYYVLLCEHCKKKHALSGHVHLDGHVHVYQNLNGNYRNALSCDTIEAYLAYLRTQSLLQQVGSRTKYSNRFLAGFYKHVFNHKAVRCGYMIVF
jgi:hypothetical protein